MSVTSERLRVEWKEGDDIRDAGLTTPDNVERHNDIVYGPYEKWNVLDVYRPKAQEGKLPVIISVHGGAWVYGDKERYQYYGLTLAQRGFAVINYTYRLAPEFKFPAQLEDLNHVVCWMYENQETYGLDMNNVFLVGDSAGGHLAALYAEISTNPEYAAGYPFCVPEDFSINAIALNSSVIVPLDEKMPVIDSTGDRELMEDLLTDKGTPEEIAWITPSLHVTAVFPPTYLMTARGDFCLPQAYVMEKVLKEKHVPYEFKVYGTEEKPLYHVFHVTIQEAEGQICNDEECAYFRKYLK